jgi:hypothetical protein
VPFGAGDVMSWIETRRWSRSSGANHKSRLLFPSREAEFICICRCNNAQQRNCRCWNANCALHYLPPQPVSWNPPAKHWFGVSARVAPERAWPVCIFSADPSDAGSLRVDHASARIVQTVGYARQNPWHRKSRCRSEESAAERRDDRNPKIINSCSIRCGMSAGLPSGHTALSDRSRLPKHSAPCKHESLKIGTVDWR